MQEMQETYVGSPVHASAAHILKYVGSPGWEDPLGKEIATYSSILPWEIPWTEEPDGLHSLVSPKAGHD